eukprot:CAMPEP_0113636180 /NCGR_PEP_ID=MMETSP0017_2-20120614/18881_1 /TAXON_ID=2856 /ORGANISM="Cylindrotheca closterium" /LENGTH=286 /DNA_ID=CAMNT_0000547035 /DNA_START=88 /DNA_END=948 /DNA_ORIENTATION=- /assembly_acc=CAM_ASM_000147
MAPNATITEYDQPLEKFVAYNDENDHTETTVSISETEKTVKRITFDEELEECEIPNREDMSEDEYYLSFYSPAEIAWMNEEQNETADRIEAGKKEKKSAPYRGLEAWTQRGQHEMNQRIFSCVDSVLDEQDKQWTKGHGSTRRLAKASKSLTKTSKNLALGLAKQDEKDARKIYESDLDGDDKEEESCIPLRAIISNSTIMKSKKSRRGSNKSLDGGSSSFDLSMSMHSTDSCDSGFFSFATESSTPKKKRKSKKKSAAREGKAPKETPAKTTASRRKQLKKVMTS